jgi:hypothetical protein
MMCRMDTTTTPRFRYGQTVWVDTRNGERVAHISYADDGGPTVVVQFAGQRHDNVYPRSAVRVPSDPFANDPDRTTRREAPGAANVGDELDSYNADQRDYSL